ncbi:cytochrome c [Pontibacter sp. G13]|uniref:c-type cytochrome n=1 Tax=Pontibacter sp. G13 TaxID=3074898 RepID=UPI00288BCD45|nr:cytochrome c [Pontibacter sp. G13]WNJ18241.1 cytochrome c [Pontibacter sp. G13]
MDQSEGGAGAKVYAARCANCHMESGQGLGKMIPSMVQSPAVLNGQGNLACLIRNGIAKDTAKVGPGMPGFELSPSELVAVINYMKNAWGNQGGEVTFAEVDKALEGCP